MKVLKRHKTHWKKNLKSVKEILSNDLGIGCNVYSPIFGDLEYLGYDSKSMLKFRSVKSNEIVFFREDGTYAVGGKVLLYPSENNTDWTNIPIKYPENETEIINAMNKTTKNSKEKIDQMIDKGQIYFYLRAVARYLDRVAGKIDIKEYPYGTRWVIEPELNFEDSYRKIIWHVTARSKDFYHFGFYRKRAAEVFLAIMLEKIEQWGQDVYTIQQPQPDESKCNPRMLEALLKHRADTTTNK